MTDQVNTLSVRAILASDDYVRGAQAVALSNKEMARSAAEAGVAITTIEVKSGAAGGGLGKLTRAYDSLGAASSKFQSDLRSLSTLLESGKVSAEQAGTIYLGMVQKLGMVADATQIAAQGFGPLAGVISGVNDNVSRHKVQVDALAASYRSLAAEARAAQSADNAQSRFNQSFGIAQPVGYSAASSGAFFEEELRKTTARRHVATTKGIPSVALNPLLAQFAQGRPVLQHGSKIGQFVSDASAFADMHSFLSVPLQSGGTVFGILNVISMTRGKAFNEGHRKMLSVLASRAATAIESVRLYCDLERTNSHLRRANLSLEENFQQTVAGFAQALEESDLYTRGHSERVATYAELIGRGLTLTETEVRDIVQSGLMHDIGKIGIRYDMLNKPGKLSPDEVKVFRTHPEKGKRILDSVPCLHGLIDGCWCHHERFDGDGYPRGLRGHDIPLLGRIVAIADAYDAMTTDRAYRRALSHEIAIGEMERCAGSQFDPEITELFLHAIERYRTEMIARGQTSELPR